MMPSLSDNLLFRLSEFIVDRLGLYFPRSRWNDLERMILKAAGEFGSSEPNEFVEWILSSKLDREKMDLLANNLTINETYFWREPNAFEALMEDVLPELINSRRRNRRLRIWCAGCASGEEPYSIAMALHRMIANLDDWNITILATDINPRVLTKAQAGIYSEWSFRNSPPWLKESYFRQHQDGTREIKAKIKEMVTFGYLNLAEDVFPSFVNNTNAMDIIFCRNVLMHFEPERIRAISQSLYHCLIPKGWLFVSASELSQLSFSLFKSVTTHGTIVYRKLPLDHKPSRKVVSPKVNFRQPGTHAISKPVDKIKRRTPTAKLFKPVIDVPKRQEVIPTPTNKNKSKTAHEIAQSVRAMANEGRLDEALNLCDQATGTYKLEAGLYYLKATILQELNRVDDAIVSLKQALYLDQNFVLARYSLGNLTIRQGNVEAGKRQYKNVLILLAGLGEDDVLPESEGMTAGRFREIIRSIMQIGDLQ